MRTDDPCRTHAPVLAALEDYEELALDTEAVDEARAHLATCARCQARSQFYARLDEALRATLRAEPALPFATADLLAAIGADHEPRERRTPMLSIVSMRDEDDVDDDNQPAQPGQDGDQRRPAASATASAPAFAPLPSIKPTRTQSPRRRALTSLVAVAAVAALVGGIVGAMNLSGRLHGGTGGHHTNSAAATATAQANQRGKGPTTLNGVTFTSPDEAWILVSRDKGTSQSDFYHYVNGKATKLAPLPDSAYQAITLRVFAPNDIWAIPAQGCCSAAHFNGQAWAQVTLPTPPNTQATLTPSVVDIVSPTEGWAIASTFASAPSGAQALTQFFYHYTGSAWVLERADSQAAMGELGGDATPTPQTDQGGPNNQIQLTGISAAPGGNVWATGNLQSQLGNANAYDSTGYLYHRVNGVWHVARVAPHTEYDSILMTGPHSGWIIGQRVQIIHGGGSIPFTEANYTSTAWQWNGSAWTPGALPQSAAFESNGMLRMVASSPSNVWVLLASNSVTVTGVSDFASDNSVLIHFDGAHWSPVALPQVAAINPTHSPTVINQVSFDHFSLNDAGDVWIAGDLITGVANTGQPYTFQHLVYHYAGGAWTSVPLPTFT